MLLSSVAKLSELLKSRKDVVPVLFLTPDYPVSDFEFIEKTMDDPTMVVFDLTEETIDIIQVTKIPQIRFYYKEAIRKKLIGGDIFKWKLELMHTEDQIKKEIEVQNERASLLQSKIVPVSREESRELSGAIRNPLHVDQKELG
jgi:hypothetical protein